MAKKAESKDAGEQSKGGKKNGSAKGATRPKSAAAATKKDVPHVVSGSRGWAVKSSLTGRFITQFYNDKSEAIDAGRKIARDFGSKVLVHGRNGQIFHHSPVRSTISESVIRDAVRASGGKSYANRAPKKSADAQPSRASASRKK